MKCYVARKQEQPNMETAVPKNYETGTWGNVQILKLYVGPIYKQQYIIYVYINFHKSFHIQYINIDIHKNITTFFVRSMFSAQFIDVDLETIQPMNRI